MLVEEQFESIFHKVASQAMGQWLTPFLVSSSGSQRVSAGWPGQTSPRKGMAGPDRVCFAHVLISRAELHEHSCTCQKQPSYTELSVMLNRVRRQEGPTSYGPELLFSGSDREPEGWTWFRFSSRFYCTEWTGSALFCIWGCGGRGQETPCRSF